VGGGICITNRDRDFRVQDATGWFAVRVLYCSRFIDTSKSPRKSRSHIEGIDKKRARILCHCTLPLVSIGHISGSVWVESSATGGRLLDSDIGLLSAVRDGHKWWRV